MLPNPIKLNAFVVEKPQSTRSCAYSIHSSGRVPIAKVLLAAILPGRTYFSEQVRFLGDFAREVFDVCAVH